MTKNNSKSESTPETKTHDRTHDGQGHEFERLPGPGPKDAGKGAGGRQAIERLEGEARVRSDDGDDDGDSASPTGGRPRRP
ncbi:MAG TPA: hypothetical protein VHU40_11435 [Polyangia bacterium]|jgi:hypothetical protein|nr:hypothetical protein [Polyangia bacterium]